MQFFVSTSSAARQRTECAVIGVFEKGTLSQAARELDERLGGRIERLTKSGDVRGKLGETLLLADLEGGPAQRVLLVGMGGQKNYGRKQYRRAMHAAAGVITKLPVREALSYLSLERFDGSSSYYFGRSAAEIIGNSLYRIPDHKSARKPAGPLLARFGIAVDGRGERAQAERGLEHGQGVVAGMGLMRDLANQPANVCTPTYLANAARTLARDYKSVRVQVLNEADAKRLKMGSFLSVTEGTEEPAKLIVLEYRGGERGAAPVVLVGKGVTFDTGGISLKPPPAMDEMKFDMSGAASVIGTFKAVAELELPINVVGVVPACENMPSGKATKPGDIVRTMSGQTVEVLNTDAEGRLILCDAITYARRFKPDVLIDIATLTGACVVALGNHLTGLFSNSDELAAALDQAGQRADDRAWRMPLGDEYGDQLKSNFADFANVAGREGGAITAACFLAKFTDGLNWAHLDIAGTAYVGGSQKSSTGRPVPLLMDYLINRAG
jgi:leucyl aminopeptidase